MTTVNLYEVLLIESDCTNTEIKNSYRKYVQIYHPDKKGGNAEMFDLITHAYNVLINPVTRASYDKIYGVCKQSELSHIDLKSRSIEYAKSLENSKKSKEESEIDFDKIFAEMDAKYGFKRTGDKKIIDANIDINEKLKDLEDIRGLDDIENTPEKIFGDKIDMDEFNTIFDNVHKKHTDLIKHNGNPIAWNTLNEYGAYSTVDNYETLFTDDDGLGTSLYGSVKLSEGNTPAKLTKKELEKLKKVDYVKGHSYKDVDYTKTLEEKMKEREQETNKFMERNMSEYSNDDKCGGYGIFSDLGLNFEDYDNSGLLEDGGDLKAKYKKLLDSRK
jgi:curved DNA-binding protein CbpA